MHRRLNTRYLVGLLAVISVAGLGVHFLHAFQVKCNASSLLNQAVKAADQRQLDQSARYLARYLVCNPNDNEARIKYGLLLESLAASQATRREALAVLEEALVRDPGVGRIGNPFYRGEVRFRIARLEMELGQFQEAKKHLEALLAASPNDAELHDLLGQCHHANKECTKAADSFALALALAPRKIDTHVRLAGLLRHQLDQPRQADRVMDNMVVANKQSYEAYLARARYRRENGLFSEASAGCQACSPDGPR